MPAYPENCSPKCYYQTKDKNNHSPIKIIFFHHKPPIPRRISGDGDPASLGEGSYAKLIVKEILIHRLELFVCRCNGAGFKLFCCNHGSAESGLLALLGFLHLTCWIIALYGHLSLHRGCTYSTSINSPVFKEKCLSQDIQMRSIPSLNKHPPQ